jgi:hypothetical protein
MTQGDWCAEPGLLAAILTGKASVTESRHVVHAVSQRRGWRFAG